MEGFCFWGTHAHSFLSLCCHLLDDALKWWGVIWDDWRNRKIGLKNQTCARMSLFFFRAYSIFYQHIIVTTNCLCSLDHHWDTYKGEMNEKTFQSQIFRLFRVKASWLSAVWETNPRCPGVSISRGSKQVHCVLRGEGWGSNIYFKPDDGVFVPGRADECEAGLHTNAEINN